MATTTQRDLSTGVKRLLALAPQELVDAVPAVSDIIDTRGFDSVELYIIRSDQTTDASIAVLLEYGSEANLSDATTVPSELYVPMAASDADGDDAEGITRLGYRVAAGKRYIRVTLTPADQDDELVLTLDDGPPASLISRTSLVKNIATVVALLGSPHWVDPQ